MEYVYDSISYKTRKGLARERKQVRREHESRAIHKRELWENCNTKHDDFGKLESCTSGLLKHAHTTAIATLMIGPRATQHARPKTSSHSQFEVRGRPPAARRAPARPHHGALHAQASANVYLRAYRAKRHDLPLGRVSGSGCVQFRIGNISTR